MRAHYFILLIVVLSLSTKSGFAETTAKPVPGLHNPNPTEMIPYPQMDQDLSIPPAGSEIICPGEYCRADGVFLAYETAFSSTGILMDIAYEVALLDSVYMIVKNSSERSQAFSQLTANGVNMDHVVFIYYSQLSQNSIWIRDYGPIYIYEDGEKAITDFWYPFTTDDYLPGTIGSEFGLQVYTNNLLFSGGNFITDGNGMGFCTEIVYSHNPSYTHAEAREIFKDYCGLDSLVVLPVIDVENTKHIDVFCKLLDDDTFIVGEYATPADGAEDNYYILNDIAVTLEGIQNLDGRAFDVVRIPMPPWEPGNPGVTRTYTNSLIINNKVLVPVYGTAFDAEAFEVYQSVLPDYEIIGIDSEQIIYRAGAVHCITKLHHSDNPLIVMHDPLESIPPGYAPDIEFSVNPKFPDTDASVFYRLESESEYSQIPAMLSGGLWSATFPAMNEDFDYYIGGEVSSGDVIMEYELPVDAPSSFFSVNVSSASSPIPVDMADMWMVGRPTPFNSETTIRFNFGDFNSGELIIYNAMGQVVKSFPALKGGMRQVKWGGENNDGYPVPSGTYFMRFSNGEWDLVRKITKLR